MKKKIISKQDPAREATRVAEEAIQNGNHKKARDFLNRALKHDPEYEPAIINLASLAIKEEAPELAAKHFETIANLAMAKHLKVKAVAALKRAIQYDPANQTLQMRLVDILRSQYTQTPTPQPHSKCHPDVSDACHAQPSRTAWASPWVGELPTLTSLAGDDVKDPGFRRDDKTQDDKTQDDKTQDDKTETKEDKQQTDIKEFNLADLSEDEIDIIAETEVLISEGAFEEALKLLSTLKAKHSDNSYIKLISEQIERREIPTKSFVLTDSSEPELDFTGAIK